MYYVVVLTLLLPLLPPRLALLPAILLTILALLLLALALLPLALLPALLLFLLVKVRVRVR